MCQPHQALQTEVLTSWPVRPFTGRNQSFKGLSVLLRDTGQSLEGCGWPSLGDLSPRVTPLQGPSLGSLFTLRAQSWGVGDLTRPWGPRVSGLPLGGTC